MKTQQLTLLTALSLIVIALAVEIGLGKTIRCEATCIEPGQGWSDVIVYTSKHSWFLTSINKQMQRHDAAQVTVVKTWLTEFTFVWSY